MPDWKQVLENALDILKYPGDLSDTLAEFQRKWGREVPALFSPRFDEINTQYIRLPHEQGVSALGSELDLYAGVSALLPPLETGNSGRGNIKR
ncbi:MAG TPA: hypothetical protein IAB36_00455 [Candidatus Egerieicola pullicola]|uniref:Uncharacterized protein n=1 Tax=Candidatus Egerieicola pullicola TaxID=2840775 RepID=A0A9D1AH93_9FIRM|nr:hypothetical protein [Candidatus Egerieicola pullicola]